MIMIGHGAYTNRKPITIMETGVRSWLTGTGHRRPSTALV
jgi:hypothetical protein